LYKYHGRLFTINELIDHYQISILETLNPESYKSIQELLEKGTIKKLQYRCIKIIDPQELNFSQIGDIRLVLVEKDKKDFISAYESKIEKSFNLIWDFELAKENLNFMKSLKTKN